MKISIAQRLKPFSHRPGIKAPIPGTDLFLRAFPTLIEIFSKDEVFPIRVHVTGPVQEFTLQVDLESNCVRLFGKAKEGFYRLRLTGQEKGVELFAEKIPVPGILVNGKELQAKEHLFFPLELAFFLPAKWERLSLGLHKAQDWDLVLRRMDPKEILPFLFALGQKSPLKKETELKGSARLLRKGDFSSFLQVAFSDLLVPRLLDDQHQGIVPEEGENEDPFFLLPSSAAWIRSIFFRQQERELRLLPEDLFETGRMTGIEAMGIGLLDLEWSQGLPRRALLHCTTKEPFSLLLPKGLRTFRLRKKQTERGVRKEAGELTLEAGVSYLLDRFQ